jgi:mannose-6-phosphate isomerase
LSEYLLQNPSLVGYNPKGYPTNDLAFLFKVLSIRTALSIQSHPDKALAAELHAKFPDIYKDGNHKPEMAIALTPFEALCGFRPVSEIAAFITDFPEFASIIGPSEVSSFMKVRDDDDMSIKQKSLKSLFSAFMHADDTLVSHQIEQLIQRITSSATKTVITDLIVRLNVDFPGDRGVLCPLLLNYLTLKSGDSFFMGPNEPHAYISGDCIECMALSDNVVRAGLTPKFKDIETLVNMLHFRCGNRTSFIQPISLDQYTALYRPPLDVCAEFEVERTELPAGLQAYSPVTVNCGCLIIVTQGTGVVVQTMEELGVQLMPGSVVFIPANSSSQFKVDESSSLVYFRAHVNLGHDDATAAAPAHGVL